MADNLHDTAFLLQNLMEHMTDNIYFKDTDSRFIMVNQAFLDWTGLHTEQVIGKTDFDLFATAHAQEAYDDEQRIIQTGEPLIGIEEKETWTDGRITWVSTTKMPLTDPEGKIIGTFGVSRNITDHKEAELQAAYYSEQIRGIKEEMENDVHMAAELQKTFFPSSYPVIPSGVPPEQSCVEFLHHYHASGVVSGDFCTIRQLSETETGIFLCDVMGHGVRAALGTAVICALVEEVAVEESDPGRFLGRMNEQLLPVLQQEDTFLYATACYLVFNAATGTLRMANAGHPHPLRFEPSRNEVSWLTDEAFQRGPALAIAQGVEFKTFETTLQPDDTVVIYTDGLYEVEGVNGEDFGEDRLLGAALRLLGSPLSTIFPALTNEACLFSVDGELDDDVCMIGLHYKNKPDA